MEPFLLTYLRQLVPDRVRQLLGLTEANHTSGHDTSWDQYKEMFGPEICDNGDPNVQQEKEALATEIKREWDRYRLGDYPNIHNAKDAFKFWQSRLAFLREAVAPYLWYPVTCAAIERSFSLAGLIDVKNRQRMGKDLCDACVTIFCNGDVEERFTKWQ